MYKPRPSLIGFIGALLFVLLPRVARADFVKTIEATPGVSVQAVATFYYASCTESLGVGSYSISMAPKQGTLSFSTVSGPVPGCPQGSPSLPAAAAFYQLASTAKPGTKDYFQLLFMLNGGVAEVDDIYVNTVTDALTITTAALPSTISGDVYPTAASPGFPLASSGGQGTVTWSASGLPEGFSLSVAGLLHNSGNPPPLADPGTYSVTVTATDSLISVSKALTLTVISEDCSENATVKADADAVNVQVDPDLTLVQRPDPSPKYQTTGKVVYLDTGHRSYEGLPIPWFAYGIDITTLPNFVSYPSNGIPTSEIQLVFMQTLDKWNGYSVYEGQGGDFQEWTAIPVNSATDDYASGPGKYYAVAPMGTGGSGRMFDSPQVHAPTADKAGRSLVGMQYTKIFTDYIGCHTARDELHFPDLNDSRHWIRTLATLQWGVNFTGRVRSCFFDPYNPFSQCFSFIPDERAGVSVLSPPQAAIGVEPPITDPPPASEYNPF